MKIKIKLNVIGIAFTCIILLMFLATLYVTNRQKDDGLLINLAGRQRMLSQKISKEIHHFLYVSEKQGKPDAQSAAMVRSTMKVFNMTLIALKDSGRAPLTLNLDATGYADCPPAKEPVLGQLEIVEDKWLSFVPLVEKVLTNTYSEQDLKKIHQENLQLLQEMNKAVVMMQELAEGSVRMLLYTQICAILLAIGCAVYSFINIRAITLRLTRIDQFSRQFGKGDLTAVSNISGKDELGNIGSSLDMMSSNLRQLIGRISGNSLQLDSTSLRLLSISDHVSEGATRVSSRSHTVAAAAEEMSVNMSSVAAAVEETFTNVSLMSEAIRDMTSAINQISEETENARKITESAVTQTESASNRVNELGSAATKIGKVTETITEISEQTNLLALNATIEAARAGEAGKGFAVVANEIKELAKQTSDATLDIRQNIEAIQSSTKITVDEIDSIAKVVGKVNEIVAGIASSLEQQALTTGEISTNVSQASEGINEVTSNVAQSSVVAGEVSSEVAAVNSDSVKMDESSTELAGQARELHALSKELADMVKKFTT